MAKKADRKKESINSRRIKTVKFRVTPYNAFILTDIGYDIGSERMSFAKLIQLPSPPLPSPNDMLGTNTFAKLISSFSSRSSQKGLGICTATKRSINTGVI